MLRITPAALASFLLLLALLQSPTQAAIVLSVGNASFAENQTGHVDVFVRSTDGSDLLDSFVLDVALSDPGITFADPTELQYGNSAYLLNGNSLNEFSGPPYGLIAGNTYSTGDGVLYSDEVTNPGLDLDSDDEFVVAVPTVDTLLLRLALNAVGQAGENFTLNITGATFYSDLLGDIPANYNAGGSDLVGDIAVQDAIAGAVPEPASLVIFGGFGLGLLVLRIRGHIRLPARPSRS